MRPNTKIPDTHLGVWNFLFMVKGTQIMKCGPNVRQRLVVKRPDLSFAGFGIPATLQTGVVKEL